MSAMASQITSVSVVYSTVYSGTDQRNHKSSTSLAFVWGIHRWPVNSPNKTPVIQKLFPFDDIIMSCLHDNLWYYQCHQFFLFSAEIKSSGDQNEVWLSGWYSSLTKIVDIRRQIPDIEQKNSCKYPPFCVITEPKGLGITQVHFNHFMIILLFKCWYTKLIFLPSVISLALQNDRNIFCLLNIMFKLNIKQGS